MSEIPEKTEHLERRLEKLELRVSRLELHAMNQQSSRATTEPAKVELAAPVLPTIPFHGGRFAHILGIAAKAVLAVAGGYLLRAWVETGWLPHSAGILAGFAYALLWIIVAGSNTNGDRASSTIYAIASAIIFFGLVLENEVSTKLLPSPIAALMILLYLCTGGVVAWIRNRDGIAIVTITATTTLSLTLLLTTHDLIPFDTSLLFAAAASEFAACNGKWLRQRWIGAFTADLAVFFTAWVFSSPSLPDGYVLYRHSVALTVQLGLVAIYLASLGYRTLVLQAGVSFFEIAQNIFAVGILILSQVVMARGTGRPFLVGVLCAAIGLGSYIASIVFTRKGATRNSLAYALFAFALAIAATMILVPPQARVFAWCFLGVGAGWLGRREHETSVQLQAPVYLLGAAVSSGLLEISNEPIGEVTSGPSQVVAIVATAIAGVLVYRLLNGLANSNRMRLAHVICAALIVLCGLGLGTIAIKKTLGTLFLATSARIALIGLAAIESARRGASHEPQRPEWVWLSYALMVYGGWRILVEDLANGRPASAALSLLFYGGTLLFITRILRPRHPS